MSEVESDGDYSMFGKLSSKETSSNSEPEKEDDISDDDEIDQATVFEFNEKKVYSRFSGYGLNWLS